MVLESGIKIDLLSVGELGEGALHIASAPVLDLLSDVVEWEVQEAIAFINTYDQTPCLVALALSEEDDSVTYCETIPTSFSPMEVQILHDVTI